VAYRVRGRAIVGVPHGHGGFSPVAMRTTGEHPTPCGARPKQTKKYTNLAASVFFQILNSIPLDHCFVLHERLAIKTLTGGFCK
jgi:hypothetical protein